MRIGYPPDLCSSRADFGLGLIARLMASLADGTEGMKVHAVDDGEGCLRVEGFVAVSEEKL